MAKSPPWQPPPKSGSFKDGGMVKKTGLAKVHKGEEVLTKVQQKKLGSKGKSSVKVKAKTDLKKE